VAGSAAAVEA
jgi:hypothetical protein